jgi:surface antigen
MRKNLLLSMCLCLGLVSCQPSNEDLGVVSGGVIGGLLGSQFGGGTGKVAAAAGGTLIGAMLGGRIGQYMDKQDQQRMQGALETTPVGQTIKWKNPDNGNQYSVKPTRTYYNKNVPCREYTTKAYIDGAEQEVHGKACRQENGSWKIVNG